MTALDPFGENIRLGAGPVISSAGFRYPTRMVVIRLADGGLFVWSPVALSVEQRAAVDALGSVRFIVAPNSLHHVFLPEWKAAFPAAALHAAPGLRARRKDIAFDADLTDTPPPGWAGEIDQVVVRGNLITTEVVFFHRKSGVALFTDLIQNFPPGWFEGLQGVIARMDGMLGAEAQVPQKFRLAFTGRTVGARKPHRDPRLARREGGDGAWDARDGGRRRVYPARLRLVGRLAASFPRAPPRASSGKRQTGETPCRMRQAA